MQEDHVAVPGQVARYAMLEADRAPDRPGIYAWYASMHIGRLDWKMEIEAGKDQAVRRFLSSLQIIADFHEPSPMAIKGSSPYGGSWDGSLEAEYAPRELLALLDEPQEDGKAANGNAVGGINSIRQVSFNEASREGLAEVLDSAVPYFASPLYIGMASNLRERLVQHRNDYSRMSDFLRKNPADAATARFSAFPKFGYRAAARGIAMERLEAWTLPIAGSSDSSTNSPVPAAAEWLLHRFFAPPLGRR